MLSLEGPWDNLLRTPLKETLEQNVVPSYLRSQRWFGGKARQFNAARLVDHGPLAVPTVPFCVLALFAVEFEDGKSDLYFLPLAIAMGDEAQRLLREKRPFVLGRLKDEAVLFDALADASIATALLDAIGRGKQIGLEVGIVAAFPTAGFAELHGAGAPLQAVLRPATSSNSLLLYGKRLLLKVFRRLEAGVNPDFEVGRFLTEQTAFTRIPRVAGAIEYRRNDGTVITLANLQALVENQGDGWEHTLHELKGYYERTRGEIHGIAADPRPLLELAASDPPPVVRETIGAYMDAAAILGKRTAEVHLALAQEKSDEAFMPEPLTGQDMDYLQTAIVEQARRSLALLTQNLDRLSEVAAPLARHLLEKGPQVEDRLGHLTPSGQKIRCHGDYHLGQVLRVGNDYVIIDFEGEPTRTVAERRAKQSPLRDVAGMLRSYHYAAYAGLFNFTQNAGELARLEPWAELWQQWASATFLRAYRATARKAAFLPATQADFTSLLQWFALEKAFYELEYELNNRPDWVRIPLSGILALLI